MLLILPQSFLAKDKVSVLSLKRALAVVYFALLSLHERPLLFRFWQKASNVMIFACSELILMAIPV
jgi:hypothetical protein